MYSKKLTESWYIAKSTQDPNLLIEILRKNKNDMPAQYAAQNPNCPPEILIEILQREKNDEVSYYAALHPNCPHKNKTEWMKKINNNPKKQYKKRKK